MAVKFNGKPNWYGYEDAKGFPGMNATSAVENQLKAIMMEKYKTDENIKQRQIELIVNSIMTIFSTSVKGATAVLKK